MAEKHEAKLIEVKVVYPSAHHPAEQKFAPDTPLSQVKQFALAFFGLHEGTEGGNQIRFFLYHRDHKIENLEQPLSAVADGHEKVDFRLAKEVIAG
jgi:hypothetical protein